MKHTLPKWLRLFLPGFACGLIGALAVTILKDHRVPVTDDSSPSRIKIISVDGAPPERRTRKYLLPAEPYTLLAPGKRSLTISVTQPDGENQPPREYTIKANIYKNLEYRLAETDGIPALVVTKI